MGSVASVEQSRSPKSVPFRVLGPLSKESMCDMRSGSLPELRSYKSEIDIYGNKESSVHLFFLPAFSETRKLWRMV